MAHINLGGCTPPDVGARPRNLPHPTAACWISRWHIGSHCCLRIPHDLSPSRSRSKSAPRSHQARETDLSEFDHVGSYTGDPDYLLHRLPGTGAAVG